MSVYPLFDPNNVLNKYMAEACSSFEFAEVVCRNLLFMTVGFDKNDLDMVSIYLCIYLDIVNCLDIVYTCLINELFIMN